MTDIVERLRDICREMPSPMQLVRLNAEAVDEIERLRASLLACQEQIQQDADEIERLRNMSDQIKDGIIAGHVDAFMKQEAEIERLRAIVDGDDIGSVKRAYADGYAAAQHEIKRLEDALRDAKAENR